MGFLRYYGYLEEGDVIFIGMMGEERNQERLLWESLFYWDEIWSICGFEYVEVYFNLIKL